MPSFHHDLFDAVAFDFDGTLADTDRAHTQARLLAYRELAVELGKPELAQIDPAIHAHAHRHGSDALSINTWVLQMAGIIRNKRVQALPKLIAKRKTENYHALAKEGLEAMPGAIEFVALAQKIWGEMMFIVTTAHRDEEVVPFLGRHGLCQALKGEQLITREDVATLKPSPEAYTLLLKKLGLEARPERLLVVEDTPNGVEAARGAGAMVVGMLAAGDREGLLVQQGFRRADDFAESFEELGDMIDV